MRILFLSRHLGPAGTTSHVTALAEGLKKAGCRVAIVSQQRGDYQRGIANSLAQHGVQCFRVDFPTPYRPWLDNSLRLLKSTIEIMRIVSDFQPDVVHVQWRSLSPYAQLIKIYHSIPFVTTLNLEVIPCSPLYRWLSFWGDRAIAISHDTQKVLLKTFHVPAQKIRIVHYGCDSDHFRPPTPTERRDARRYLGLADDDHVVSIVARLSPEKRHDVALRALTTLKSRGKTAHVLLAGAPWSKEVTPESLMKLATEMGIAHLIHILGHIDTRTVLWASDLTILPSNNEGFALAIVEAMLCGTIPVRTPAAGAIDQIDNEVNGFIVPFDDPVALANRIDQLLADPFLRQRMAAAAIATAREKFSLHSMIEKTIKVYETVLAQ